jgi:cellulose synthase/poly-beta-1,6-N-acetylglucosamine synthase-like glycosyltransferase
MIFSVFSIVILAVYIALIISITMGWRKLKTFKSADILPVTKVSVIVAVRNEALNVGTLLDNLLHQDYSPLLYEIIIVDDHSADQTSLFVNEIIEQQTDTNRLKLIMLGESDSFGKKNAITQGILASNGELIIFTDADCTSGKQWISTLAAYYEKYKPHMILGPVRMTDGGSFFGKLQSLEFISLISSAAGSCGSGFPLLANGANIAFTRMAFDSCGGFASNMHYPSGDDMFLLMSIKKKFGAGAIRFLRADLAIVDTPPTSGLKPFIQQRKRWVSKSRAYTDPLLIATSLVVFLTNVLLLTSAALAIFSPGYRLLFFVLYLVKLAVDFPLMLSFSRFERSTRLLWLFPLMEMLNAIYTFYIGIAGNFGKYEWKGRNT